MPFNMALLNLPDYRSTRIPWYPEQQRQLCPIHAQANAAYHSNLPMPEELLWLSMQHILCCVWHAWCTHWRCLQNCSRHYSTHHGMECVDDNQQHLQPNDADVWTPDPQRHVPEHDDLFVTIQSPGSPRTSCQVLCRVSRSHHHCKCEIHQWVDPHERHWSDHLMRHLPTWPWRLGATTWCQQNVAQITPVYPGSISMLPCLRYHDGRTEQNNLEN